ncbi:MAG: carboxypeptidase-like regulatory domain-containing protein [Acidobacteriota bacterium]|nr:carboxypeptidase-like regulatory domain-containing protein [Acidobacteriota bacterium]
MRHTKGIRSLLFLAYVFALFIPLQAENPETGTISGRVLDAQNQPIAGIRVLLLKGTHRQGYDPGKTRTEATDAAGKYKFSDVLAGDYLIAAEPDEQNDPNGRLIRFYFPESMSGKGETYTLRVGPGSVLTAIDIRCVPVKLGFEAKGKVVEPGSVKPVTHMRLYYGKINGSVRQDVQTDAQGSFVITQLDPGKYWVSIAHPYSEDYYGYPTYFEITSNDVSGLQISVHKGVSLKGTIVLNKGIPETLFSELNVVFHPNGISEINQHPPNYIIDRHLEKSSPVSAEGHFMIRGLPPLIGKLSLQRRAGIPLEGYFVRIEQNGMNISDALRVHDKDEAGITIQLTGAGRIQGAVKAVNSIVDFKRIRILISLQNASVASFAKSMPLDDSGRFAFDGLMPGEYRVMAAITLENGLSRRSGDVYMTKVRESETQEVEVLLSD